MRNLVILFCFLSVGYVACGQSDSDVLLKQADAYLDSAVAEVLLLGVFHFNYPGLDAHTTEDRDKVDILSSQRQNEVKDLVDRLSAFKPTKIAVESMSQDRIDSLYSIYRVSRLEDKRSEIVQIGFRLASKMNHDTVYAVDASIPNLTVSEQDIETFSADFSTREQHWEATYGEYMNYLDSLQKVMPLLDYLLFTNSENIQQREHGQYLLYTSVGTKAKPVGADLRFPRWFNRNVRIFSNIQRIVQPGDRILVIFGYGHIHMLKDLFTASRDFEVADLTEYLSEK